MDEVEKLKLVSFATVQVAKRLEAFMDFEISKDKGRAFMEMAAGRLGLSPSEGSKAYNDALPEFKEQLLAWAQGKAKVEMAAAIQEAEAEQHAHTRRLAELNELHRQTMEMLADRHKVAVPEGADDEFVRLINSSHEKVVQTVERFHREFMGVVQKKHCLNLEHCFSGHLVPEGTVLILLTELYEVK